MDSVISTAISVAIMSIGISIGCAIIMWAFDDFPNFWNKNK